MLSYCRWESGPTSPWCPVHSVIALPPLVHSSSFVFNLRSRFHQCPKVLPLLLLQSQLLSKTQMLLPSSLEASHSRPTSLMWLLSSRSGMLRRIVLRWSTEMMEDSLVSPYVSSTLLMRPLMPSMRCKVKTLATGGLRSSQSLLKSTRTRMLGKCILISIVWTIADLIVCFVVVVEVVVAPTSNPRKTFFFQSSWTQATSPDVSNLEVYHSE